MRNGHYVYTSGQLPMVAGALAGTGKVGAGDGLSAERRQGARAACALNAIAAVKSILGDLDKVVRVVKVVGFVASAPVFTGQPGVVNGASELLGTAFGDAGCTRVRGRRRGAAARRPGRGRDRRRGRGH